MQTQQKLRAPLPEAGLNYSLAAVLPLFLAVVFLPVLQLAMGEGYTDTVLYRFLSFLLPQVGLGVCALIFFRRKSLSPRKVYTPCKWYYYLIAVLLAFGLLFALNTLNDLFIALLKCVGYTPQSEQEGYIAPVTSDMVSGFMLIPSILIIAVLPAFFEETTFRGIQLGAMRESGWGTASAVLIVGALFSLYHGNPEQTIYQFVCGTMFALLAVRSGSLYPSMLAHFLNNAVILVMAAVMGVDWSIPKGASVALTVCGAVALVGAAMFLFFDGHGAQKGPLSGGKGYFLTAAVGIAACAIEWIVLLVTGFAA